MRIRRAQCGFFYYDKKGVVSGQYYSLSKKLAKIGDFDKSGLESSIEIEISFSKLWLVLGKISVEVFIISHLMKSYSAKYAEFRLLH